MTRFGWKPLHETSFIFPACRMAVSPFGDGLDSVLHKLAAVQPQTTAAILPMNENAKNLDNDIIRSHCRRHGEHDEECIACQQAEIHRKRMAWTHENKGHWKPKKVEEKERDDKVIE